MKSFTVSVVSVIVTIAVFVGGYCTRTVLAQQNPAAASNAEKLPADIRPDTLDRIPWATRGEFTTKEDQAAYDRAIAAFPELAKIPDLKHEEPGNGLRLHIPIVHIAYRVTIQNLNQLTGTAHGPDPLLALNGTPDDMGKMIGRYNELATLVACRENNVEYDWVNHLTHHAVPLNIVEVLRTNGDTKGLDEKDAVLIQFGRELFRRPKVSSKTFADMERLFGRRRTLAMTLIMAHYVDNGLLYRAYDQRLAPGEKRPFSDVLLGNGFHRALAQQSLGAGQSGEKLPPDIRSDTLDRMPWPTRGEFTTKEDQAAYDSAIAARPEWAKIPDLATEEPGNGLRLHIPIVHIAYRDAIVNLNQKNGLETRYHELATLVACRENDVEYDWVNHLRHKAVPLNIVEILRTDGDTKGLAEKDAALIQFGRELFRQPKISSKTFADMERLFGRRGTLALTLIMAHYDDNGILYRAYDQRLAPGEKHPFLSASEREAKGQ
jgi:hypothetical protein